MKRKVKINIRRWQNERVRCESVFCSARLSHRTILRASVEDVTRGMRFHSNGVAPIIHSMLHLALFRRIRNQLVIVSEPLLSFSLHFADRIDKKISCSFAVCFTKKKQFYARFLMQKWNRSLRATRVSAAFFEQSNHLQLPFVMSLPDCMHLWCSRQPWPDGQWLHARLCGSSKSHKSA